jgi:hypothetical protein
MIGAASAAAAGAAGRSRDRFVAGVTRRSERVAVFLDGQPRPLCVRANRRQGWAASYVIDPTSGLVEHDDLDRPVTIIERGRVEFRLTCG